MIRGLFSCAIACCVAAPGMAGERGAISSGSRGLQPLLAPVAVEFPGREGALTIRGDVAVRLRGTRSKGELAEFEDRVATPFDIAPDDATAPEPITLASPYGDTNSRTLRAWRVTQRLAPVTTTANGFYAVRDGLADYRKPRAYRPSALGAMLVLRIDGKDDSPPFSVGGGGVAAALWRAVPQ